MSEAMNYKLPPPNFEEWFRESVGVSFDGAKQRGAWDLKLIAEAFEAGRAYALAAIEAQGVPDGWQPTPENINALPKPVRHYIHDLVSNADPAGTVRDLTIAQDTIRELEFSNRLLRDACNEVVGCFDSAESEGLQEALANTTDERLKDLVERRLMYALYACQSLASAPPAPQAEIVEATQPHPTNNYLFKLLCEKAGIVLGVDRVDTACEKVARMSPCVDSKCPNYWDDAYDDLKPGDVETDCEPAPQEVVEHQSPESLGDSDKKEQPHKAAGSGLVQSLTTSQESVGGLRELYGDAYGETPPAPRAEKTHVLVPLRMTKAMREVVDVEDWSWAELLAAAEAVTEDEHAIAEQASVVQQDQSDREYAYGVIDRFLRNSLHDEGYEEFSEALDTLYTHPAQQAKPQPLSETANVRGRWNIELDGDDLLVCFNDHDKGESCSYQRYVPAQQAKPQPLSDEQSRELAEQHYVCSQWYGADLSTGIGSRQWCVYWDGWRAAHGITKE